MEGQIFATDEALENLDKINLEFVQTNLDLIDFKKFYTVKKIKDTSGNSPIFNNQITVYHATIPNLIVTQSKSDKIMLILYFEGFTTLFRTSPVKNVTKKGKKILVETENSIYELMEQ